MRLKVSFVQNGLQPDQLVVSVEARDGHHYLVVHESSFSKKDSSIEVGNPVGQRSGEYLVELPAEADDGAWRLWVNKELVSGSLRYEAAE